MASRSTPSVPSTPAPVAFERADVEQSIPSRFEQQVRRYGGRLAVATADHAWTYDVLNRRANRLAHEILARAPDGRTPVGVLLEQGAPLIAATLAVFKAGKILVGLDPAHPEARLRALVGEAQPTCLVTDGRHLDAARRVAGSGVTVLDAEAVPPGRPDSDPGRAGTPGDPAMILYTSGSTGRPKGVLCDHRAWVHNAWNYTKAFQVSAEDRPTLLSLGTSQAIKNLLLALLNGGALFPFDVRRGGLSGLAELMRREAITITVMGASLFRALTDVLAPDDRFPHLRLIRLGSEPVQAADVARFRPHIAPSCLVVNGLASGETQTTRFFCVRHDTPLGDGLLPVGYPVEDKTIRLLDDAGHEVPTGEVGEIVVESRYLALGYWRRPDLTDAAFRPADTPDGPRRYHTGDLGQLAADGCLTYVGRKTSRVKIRGHGVDLVEVEMAVRALEGVKDAVVTAPRNRAGFPYLVAYVVPVALPGPGSAALREALARVLPDASIPSTFVVLGALPRTTSGKVDREALPAPGRPYRDPTRPATPPRTPEEAAIAAIWADVMGEEIVDVHEHFYDLGGESLQAMRIMARIRKTFAVDVDLQSLLDAPTVAELARVVADARGAGTGPRGGGPRPAAGTGPLPLSPVQARMWIHCRRAHDAYIVRREYDIRGPLQVAALARNLEELVRRHKILRTAYIESRGTPVQVVLDEPPSPVLVVRAAPPPAGRATPEPAIDATRGAVFRALLTRLGDTEHRLHLAVHHLAVDGRSTDLLLTELGVLFDAFVRGAPSPLPDPPLQYGDYALWQRDRLAPDGDLYREQLAYWRRTLASPPKALILPFPRGRPWTATPSESIVQVPYAPAPGGAADGLAQRERFSPFTLLVAGLATVFHHATGRRDLLLGTYVSLRSRPELDCMIGLFSNLVVLRVSVNPAGTLRELLAHVRDTVAEASAHAELPFETVRRVLRRSGVTVPGIDVIVSHGAERRPSLSLAGLDVTPRIEPPTRFGWGLTVDLRDGNLGARFDPRRHAPRGVLWLVTELAVVLDRGAADPTLRIVDLAPAPPPAPERRSWLARLYGLLVR